MVSLSAGAEAVRAYVKEQAGKGLEHIIVLVQNDRDAIAIATDLLTEEEANYSPAEGEFSILQVLQHLNGSFPRSLERLKTLSSGKAWVNQGPAAVPGGIPMDAPSSFALVRQQFLDGEDQILKVLKSADPTAGLDLTANHAEYGAFNWLEWATYSHHVHARDHVGQIQGLRQLIDQRRNQPLAKRP